MMGIEKQSKTMRRVGAFNIAMGIVTIATGVACGVGSIICGGKLRAAAKKAK